jgi:hypothetical protein
MMARDTRLEQIDRIFEDAIKDAYERGRKDALAAILKAATGEADTAFVDIKPTNREVTASTISQDWVRKRAPRGSVAVVIRRSLDRHPEGATIRQMMDAREGEDELMIVGASIRGELRRFEGEKYISEGDRWHYAKAPQDGILPPAGTGGGIFG